MISEKRGFGFFVGKESLPKTVFCPKFYRSGCKENIFTTVAVTCVVLFDGWIYDHDEIAS